MSDQAFNGQVQLRPHLERDGLLSPLVTGHNHDKAVGWMTFTNDPERGQLPRVAVNTRARIPVVSHGGTVMCPVC